MVEESAELRRVSVWHTMFYGVILAAGLSMLSDPPSFLSLGLGGGLPTVFRGCLLVFGGVVGAASVIPGACWVERIALAAIVLAVILYVLAMGELQRHVPSNIGYQALINAGLFTHLIGRLERISYGLRDPEKYTPRLGR